ncbi:hypothetical protein [Lacicoccus alkaliphilus]|uniref:Protein-tyrosine phosphatase n=1 Tax=Lacicoccus alkaliphilus DSM 16010 TaxID=1123231 RepID=A0A1M7IDD0_9BACL|nr:hypothetical protein [Salinicoccus alkaliphilus]SHM38598.1 protein-tyrosine phosphatase [Salinicoccus alkaliphilus DSM 16010]
MNRRIIFVCTGNTCRSPLAESYAKTISKGSTFTSRGLMVTEDGVNPGTMKIVEDEGLVRPEGPAQLKPEDVEGSVLLVMTRDHESFIKSMYPEAEVYLLSEYADGTTVDITDPIGGSDGDYRAVYSQLTKFLGKLFK